MQFKLGLVLRMVLKGLPVPPHVPKGETVDIGIFRVPLSRSKNRFDPPALLDQPPFYCGRRWENLQVKFFNGAISIRITSVLAEW